MADKRQEQLERALLGLLPLDGSTLGNGQLLTRLTLAAAEAGETVTEVDFATVRESLLAQGLVVKGKGRGGSTARAAAAAPGSESFALQVEAPEPDDC